MMTDLKKKRWGRHFTDQEIAFARENNRLLTMEIETSHICNLNCIYCYNGSGKKLENELSYEEITDAIDQGIDLGVRRVIIIGGGEPLMHPDCMKIIQYLYEKETAIDLFTNGTLIDKDMAEGLYAFGVEPVVKFNSLRAETQDYLANKERTFDRIQEGIKNLIGVGYTDKDHDLGVESIVCAQNYDEMPAMWRWARERNIIPYFEMITFQGRAKKRKELNVPVKDIKRLFEKLSTIDRTEYGHEWEPHPPIAALSCSRHEYSCTITSNGYVQPCTGVDLMVGNIRHSPLEEILRTSVVINCLRNVRKNIKGECRTCDMLHECYGCRGMAYHLTGDFLASDPLCWRNPKHIKQVRQCVTVQVEG
jgi:radical SAM protein with 4Fe4S-binding SPASM domain